MLHILFFAGGESRTDYQDILQLYVPSYAAELAGHYTQPGFQFAIRAASVDFLSHCIVERSAKNPE